MDNQKNIAIVVVAYNRPDALLQLLNSLNKVDYEGYSVPLIISIDYSGKEDTYRAAESFEWSFGEKKIIRHPENLGLKKHVLSCGDLVKDYDAVIILEDDLLVSPSMYSYAWRAVEKYKDDENIAAISLYAKGFSETAQKPFVPAPSKYDTYFIQTAESWGQVWMRDQWFLFKDWFELQNDKFGDSEAIPRDVRQWDDRSWKKFHIKYCIENSRYTVYPYTALTTCRGEEGEHVKNSMNTYQVPLACAGMQEYCFADYAATDSVKYDAFMERVFENAADTCIDLFGTKTQYDGYRYVITPKLLDFQSIETYGLSLRPHEENIIAKTTGNYFVKYDLSAKQKNAVSYKTETALKYYNYVDYQSVTSMMLVKELIYHLFRVIKYRIKKKLRK